MNEPTTPSLAQPVTPSYFGRNNFTAVVPPTDDDDETQGYARASFWYDSVLNVVWTCIDATTATAVWIPVSDADYAAIRSVQSSRLLGRTTAGFGYAELIELGAGLKFTASVLSATLENAQRTAPAPANGHSVIWTASGSGTKDGQAYSEADVLITSVNAAGTSKTLLILDFSTL